MNVGFMRNFKNPSYLTKLTAIYSKAYGINVIYLRPCDVDTRNGTVNGRMLSNNKWLKIQTSLPKFIDISPYCFKTKNKEVIDFLRRNATLSDNGLKRFNKEQLQQELAKDEDFKHLIIPTQIVENIDSITGFLKTYKKVILKPIAGQFGQDVFYLCQHGQEYNLKYGSVDELLNYEQVKSFYETKIQNKNFIVQKYIQSKNKQGYPFDCRINMEKNIKGQWKVARMFIRIGVGQSVVSNISQGGAVSNLTSFLNANFEDKTREIIKRLNKVSTTLPYKIEDLRETELMTLGIDIGIDLDGEIYLFETNSAPGTTQLRAQAAMYRSEYYRYITDRIEE